jgi:hypothetical protein
MDTFEIICSLFNQYVFNIAKNNIDLLYSYFSRQPGGRKNNQLCFDFLEIIKNNNFEDIGYPNFMEALVREGKTEIESREIIDNLLKWKSYSQDQIMPARKLVKSIISSTVINKANELFPNQPEEYIQYIKNAEIKTGDKDLVLYTSFDQLDIDAIVAEEATEQYVSSMDFLNQSYEPYHTVPGSQMIIVSGLPGTGKSLQLAAEALQYATNNGGRGGVHVIYYVLGDLKPRDVTIRLNCLLTGCTFAESTADIKGAYRRVKQAVGDRLHLVFAPAGKISADDICDHARNHPEIKVIIVDYDSLLAPVRGGVSRSDSLYISLSEQYDKMTELTSDVSNGNQGRLVYIASQPKSFGPTDNTESFTGAALGDSRHKFECADVVITWGIAQDVSIPMGIINLSKNRRGKKGRYYYVRPEARNMIIPKGVYDYLKQEYAGETGSKVLTEAMVNDYIRAYQVQMNQINAGLQMQGQRPQPGMQMQGQPTVQRQQPQGVMPGSRAKSPFEK